MRTDVGCFCRVNVDLHCGASVGADLKLLTFKGAVQNVHAVERGGFSNAVNFCNQLFGFCHQRAAVRCGVGVVCRLNSKFAQTLQHVRNFDVCAFGGVHQVLTVGRVTNGLVQAHDLSGHFLANRHASGVIFCCVDTKTSRKTGHRSVKVIVDARHIGLCVDRANVGIDRGHVSLR